MVNLLGGEFIAGMVHDIVGTRLNIFVGLLLICAASVAMPFGSAPLPYLVFARAVLLLGMAPVLTNPLLVDYVEHDSQGVAGGWL